MRTEGTKVLGETRCKRPKGKKGKGANGGYGDVGKAVDKSMRKKMGGSREMERQRK